MKWKNFQIDKRGEVVKLKEPKNKKILIIITVIAVIGLVLLFVFTNRSIEKQIVGKWTSIGGEECDNNMNEIITFRKDKTIEGIEGFTEYQIEETKHDEYDYVILSGVYEDTTRYRIKVSDDKLSIVYEEGDTYDFDSAIACHMNKK